jgi:hypothetical protein
VPFHNEAVYAQRVADRGNSDLLVQRAIRGVSHFEFTPAEFSTAFLDLLAWETTGVKPAGDVVLTRRPWPTRSTAATSPMGRTCSGRPAPRPSFDASSGSGSP